MSLAFGENRESGGIGYGVRNCRLVEGSAHDQFFVGNAEKILSDVMICEKLGIGYIALNLIGKDFDETAEKIGQFAREIISPLSSKTRSRTRNRAGLRQQSK